MLIDWWDVGHSNINNQVQYSGHMALSSWRYWSIWNASKLLQFPSERGFTSSSTSLLAVSCGLSFSYTFSWFSWAPIYFYLAQAFLNILPSSLTNPSLSSKETILINLAILLFSVLFFDSHVCKISLIFIATWSSVKVSWTEWYFLISFNLFTMVITSAKTYGPIFWRCWIY